MIDNCSILWHELETHHFVAVCWRDKESVRACVRVSETNGFVAIVN
jgi:hypothetical protein